jgi:DNA-binding cell septation regulator SpoVG
MAITITSARLAAASADAARAGLLGWVSCTLNGRIRLDGLALRRTLDGRLVVSFPARRDTAGRRHFLVRPLDADARRELQRQILDALGLSEKAAP